MGIRGLGLLALACGLAACNRSSSAGMSEAYLSCKGVTGLAREQSLIPYTARAITDAQGEVAGSAHITDTKVEIEGIPLVAGSYGVCRNDDQALYFNITGHDAAGFCLPGDDNQSRTAGVFNKVNGQLIYHDGDVLAILSCKAAKKLLN